MFDIVLCQRDYEKISKLGFDQFKVAQFESDQQLKNFLKAGKKVLFITTKTKILPDLLNLYNQNKSGNSEFYYLSSLNDNPLELDVYEKFFPEVTDLTLCHDFYTASGVFYIETLDEVGMPSFSKAIMPIVKEYFKLDEYKKTLFLDRDGVLNVDHSYVHKVEELDVLEGVKDFLNDSTVSSYLKIVLTNQSGVSKGLFSLDEVITFNNALNKELGDIIDSFHIAPYEFHKGVDEFKFHSLLRKPHPGMLFQACYENAIDIKNSIMIGDKSSDQLNYELLRTLHIKGNYDLSNAQNVYSSFDEILEKISNLQ